MVPASMMGTGAMGGYASKVLSYGPIAYWPLWEAAGATAQCLVNPAQNGTYTGVDLANDLVGPFGSPAPYFDGANDYVNVFSAAFAAAFSGLEGTAIFWARVANAGVWTDGVNRMGLEILADGNNRMLYYKHSGNNQFTWLYVANADFDQRNYTPFSTTNWFCAAITWSDSSNQAIAYINGVQIGAALTPIGTWAGVPINTRTNIGCENTVGPTLVWHGWLAHCVIWNYVLPTGALLKLANP